MNSTTLLKDVMSFDEMAEAFVKDYPYYVPNKARVGRFAKAKGYVVCKQKNNYKQTYFYVKQEIVNRPDQVKIDTPTSIATNASPYDSTCGIHFYCTMELFFDVRLGVIFQYLFSEYVKRVRQNQNPLFTFSSRKIYFATAINRSSTRRDMESLVQMGVIEIDNTVCKVNAAYFMKVATLYEKSKNESKQAIREAFVKHDVRALEAFGLNDVQLDAAAQNLYNLINK